MGKGGNEQEGKGEDKMEGRGEGKVREGRKISPQWSFLKVAAYDKLRAPVK